MRSRIAAGVAALVVLAAAADAKPRALLARRLIDGVSARPRTGRVAVVVDGERIVKVGSPRDIPRGAEVIDLGDRTLMPGLIDAHAHPLIRTDDYQGYHLKNSSAWKALRGLKTCQELARRGWTSMRVAGDADVGYAHLEIRRAIDEGVFRGPRLCGAGHYLSITGGGGDVNHLSYEQAIVADGLVVDGVDAIRKAVRTEVKHGSDWIKVLASGAFMTSGDGPRQVHFSPEELGALVEEANRLAVPVMAHAHGAEAIKAAVRAGARSIEHGTFVDAEGIRLMKARGTWLVPTLYIGEYFLDEHPASEAQAKLLALTKKYRAEHWANVSAAIRAGVKIAPGTDYVGWPEELGVKELEMLVDRGMTPMQVLRAVTRGNAELLGWEDRVGAVREGLLADLVAMPGDPAAAIEALADIDFVMIGGEVYRGLRE